jgi:hypothetical protein
MPRPIPFQAPPKAARARLNKAMLLPIPRAVADELALAAHVSLAGLRAGCGWMEGAQRLTEVMLLASFIADAGYGPFTAEALVASDTAMADVFNTGRDSGTWALDADGYEWFASIVCLHDWQLRNAPMFVLAEAGDRLDRYKAGVPLQSLQKKRA